VAFWSENLILDMAPWKTVKGIRLGEHCRKEVGSPQLIQLFVCPSYEATFNLSRKVNRHNVLVWYGE
jgi:hypothetical protein